MDLSRRYRNVFFIGIGGIGMSAIARWFHANGFRTGGYDRVSTHLTTQLTEEGIYVIFEDALTALSPDFLNPDNTLVVYTPAIPGDSPLLNYFRVNGYRVNKRSEILGLLSADMTTVAIAGTHGKTTTSSMVAHIIRNAGKNCAAFLGGITNNYGTNFLLNQPTDNLKDVLCVVEADEYDRSFLTLYPQVAIVTSTDADHLDIYGEHREVLLSFQDFVNNINRGGSLFLKNGLTLRGPQRTLSYGLNSGAFHAKNLRVENARFIFDIHTPDGTIRDIALQTPGYHNVENAVAASAAALEAGVTPDQVRDGLNTFKGVRRRFEYILEGATTFIDDYAHHPAEISAFLRSVRALYPNRTITVIFQPHLFSRTRDFADEFATSLAFADKIYLLDIYPARETPIEGVDSDMLLRKIPTTDKQLVTVDSLFNSLQVTPPDVLVTLGAGDIDKIISQIKAILQSGRIL